MIRKIKDHKGFDREQIVIPLKFRGSISPLCQESDGRHLSAKKSDCKILSSYLWPITVNEIKRLYERLKGYELSKSFEIVHEFHLMKRTRRFQELEMKTVTKTCDVRKRRGVFHIDPEENCLSTHEVQLGAIVEEE